MTSWVPIKNNSCLNLNNLITIDFQEDHILFTTISEKAIKVDKKYFNNTDWKELIRNLKIQMEVL